MIVAAAFCPNPPVLIPGLAQGAAPELDDLRRACHSAITRLGSSGAPIVVIGSGSSTRRHDATARGTFAGYGIALEVGLGADEPGPLELPLSLTVGAWLLRAALGANCGARGLSVADDTGGLSGIGTAGDVALLVMGDGSARRSTAAPGYLDERAEPFDAAVEAALRSGDPSTLATLDAALGAELLAAGVPAWRAAGVLAQGRYAGELLYAAAPYGVGYFVATWTPLR